MTAGLRDVVTLGGRRWRVVALALLIVAVGLLASPYAFYAFFWGLQDYDDEGYLLISLREYARGGVLYDDVYSQYGPAYFQLLTPIFRVGDLAFVPMHGRALGMLLLLVTTIVCGVAIWRLTRSFLITALGELLVAHALVPSRNEPLHPGAPLALLLVVLILAGTFLDQPRWRRAASLTGLLLGLMLLMKVNVGVFAIAGVAGALVAACPPSRPVSGLRVAVTAGMAALPIGLMMGAIAEPPVRAYLAVAFASAVGVAAVAFTVPGDRARVSRQGWTVAIAGAVVLSASLVWELVRGTTIAGLLDGIILGPLRHPAGFLYPPVLGPEAYVTAATGLGGALAFAWARRRGWTERPIGSAVLGGVLLLIGAVLWLGTARGYPAWPLALMPFLWVALAGRAPRSLGLLILAMVAALQTLHAYPVAGTQLAWATFLAVPVGGVALVDGWRRLGGALEPVLGGISTRLVAVGLGSGLALTTMSGVYVSYRWWEGTYAEGVPLGLPGAERVRVPAEQAKLYRLLAGNLSTRCRTFVTQPGLFSFHLFTGIDPPTRLNATVWMILLSDAQQAHIVERLVAAPTPVCALRRQRGVFRTPLARYIEERFVTLFEIESFEFRVRREPDSPASA